MLAATAASGTVVGAHLAGLPLLLAAVAGGVAYLGLSLILRPAPDSAAPATLPADTRLILREASLRVDALATTATKLPAALATQTDDIVGTARQIIAELTQDPRQLEAGRRFLTHYLDSTQTVLAGYRRLSESRSGQLTPELIEQITTLLITVAKSFRQQKESLLADDVLRLKTEMQVLQNSMRMEG